MFVRKIAFGVRPDSERGRLLRVQPLLTSSADVTPDGIRDHSQTCDSILSRSPGNSPSGRTFTSVHRVACEAIRRAPVPWGWTWSCQIYRVSNLGTRPHPIDFFDRRLNAKGFPGATPCRFRAARSDRLELAPSSVIRLISPPQRNTSANRRFRFQVDRTARPRLRQSDCEAPLVAPTLAQRTKLFAFAHPTQSVAESLAGRRGPKSGH